MFPSDDPEARQRPSSCGAHAIEFTDDLWLVKVWASVQSFRVPSFQIMTVPSYEQDARRDPNFGWAHATCQTGPLWPVNVARGCEVVVVVVTLIILMVASEEADASRFP